MRRQAKKKVVIIGLDGMPWHIIQILVDRAVMPNLKNIINHGARGILRSTIPPFTSTSWTSIATGVNPGKHGIFSFQRFNKRSYNTRLVNSLDIMYPRLNEIMMINGFRSVTVNLPHSYPFIKSKKQIIITDWLTPKFEVYPDKIKNLVSSYNYSTNWAFDKKIDLTELENRINAITNLFDHTNWDLFFVVFSEPDWIMHWAYDAIKQHRKGITQKIYNSFNIIDKFIGHVISKLNENDMLIILSDHGFVAYEKIIYVNTILLRAGFLSKSISKHQKDAFSRMRQNKQKKLLLSNLIMKLIIKSINSPSIHDVINKNIIIRRIIKKTSQLAFGNEAPKIQYSPKRSSSKAFTISGSPYGIYINTKRMFKYGLIEPEMESTLTDEIISILSRVKDPITGSKLFSFVAKREEVYWGPYVRRAPHVIFIPNTAAGYNYSLILYPNITEKRRSFSHTLYGVFIAYGDIVKDDADLGIVNVYDLVPTVLHYFGLPIPFDTDGESLFNIYNDDDICDRAIKSYNYLDSWRVARQSLSARTSL